MIYLYGLELESIAVAFYSIINAETASVLKRLNDNLGTKADITHGKSAIGDLLTQFLDNQATTECAVSEYAFA